MPSPGSNLPWAMAASDIFAFEGRHYLVLVDYYSKYIEVTKLNDLTSQDTIEALKEHFSRHEVERSRSSSQNNKITLEEKTMTRTKHFWSTEPPQGINLSPSQLSMGRRLRTTLPLACGLLEPEANDIKEIRERMKYVKEK